MVAQPWLSGDGERRKKEKKEGRKRLRGVYLLRCDSSTLQG